MITRTFYHAFDRLLFALRFALLAAIAGVIVAGGYHIMSHPGAVNAANVWATSDGIGGEGVRGRIKAFKMSEKTAGEDRWNITADVVSMKDDVREMTEVHMRYLPAAKRGLMGLDLSSPAAVVQNATSDIVFSGGVSVKTNGAMPAILHAQTLNWSQKKRQIFTGDAVRLESRKAVITGRGLVVDMERQTFTVLNAVQAAF